MSGGIEGKWGQLNESLEETKQKVLDLESENVNLLRRLADLDPEKVVLLERLREVQTVAEEQSREVIFYDTEEQEAMDNLLAAFNIIGNRWKLELHRPELTQAVHTIQGFINQHMLSRVDDTRWASWWQRKETGGIPTTPQA